MLGFHYTNETIPVVIALIRTWLATATSEMRRKENVG